MNTWYVLAKKDKRYKYSFHPIFNRSHVFKDLNKAITIKNLKEQQLKKKIVVLKRTCELIIEDK